MQNLPKYFSAAALLSYLQCPYKFKLLYIDRVGALYKKTKPYQAVGDTIHKVLAEFFKIRNLEERTVDKLLYMLDYFWISEGYTSKEQEAEFKHNAAFWLRNFYANNDMKVTPLYVEEFFRVGLEDFYLTGKIDRIDDVGDGVEIIDYKTGGYIPTENEFATDLQMDIYALCCWEKYKLFPKIVSQIFLQYNQKISVSKTPDNLKETKKKIIDIVREIYENKEFLPVRNNLCPYCDFLTICPEVGMGVKVVKQKELEKDFREITKHLERSINDLHMLNRISLDISEILESEKLIASTPEFIKGLAKVKKVVVYIYDEEKQSFYLASWSKSVENINLLQNISFIDLLRMFNTTLENLTETLVCQGSDIEDFKIITRDEILFIPMLSRDKVLGFILVADKEDYTKFTNYDITLIQNLVRHISVALNNAQLYELAITDSLTKVFIQRYFMSRLEYEILRCERYNTIFSLLMIDIDFFKRINDTYGHLVGDAVLKQVAQVFLSSVRTTDIVCRYGGEEFAILLIECGSNWAEKIAYRIKEKIENTIFKINTLELKLTISIGVKTYFRGMKSRDIIEQADKALYVAKSSGRNKVVVYDKISSV
ncbi:MAG: diguanylate cyclase [Endomicrobia bacterium]|nr:diguanylate cyclase [Endomicrobiia bacterium]MDW8055656.1 diguanylate cyclase [Elusimicrobiota bacterium]